MLLVLSISKISSLQYSCHCSAGEYGILTILDSLSCLFELSQSYQSVISLMAHQNCSINQNGDRLDELGGFRLVFREKIVSFHLFFLPFVFSFSWFLL